MVCRSTKDILCDSSNVCLHVAKTRNDGNQGQRVGNRSPDRHRPDEHWLRAWYDPDVENTDNLDALEMLRHWMGASPTSWSDEAVRRDQSIVLIFGPYSHG